MVMQNEAEQMRSSPVGWPFWVSVLVTAVPFTILFGFFATRQPHDPIAWWEWALALPLGLMPAMLLGLVVQTVWSICISAAHGVFGLVDGVFALLLLALCSVPGWLYWRFGDALEGA